MQKTKHGLCCPDWVEYGLRRRQVHVELHSGGRRAAAQGTAPDNPPTTLAWRHLGQRLTSKSYGEHRSRPSFKKAPNSSGTLFPSHRAFSGPFALLPLNDQVLAARNIGRDDGRVWLEKHEIFSSLTTNLEYQMMSNYKTNSTTPRVNRETNLMRSLTV